MHNMRTKKSREGQAMVLVTILLSGIMMSASAIAGLLMYYQLKQSNDVYASNIAVFAADAGLNAAFECYYFTPGFPSVDTSCYELSGNLSNGGAYETKLECKKDAGTELETVECSSGDVYGFTVRSRGFGPGTERILESFVSIRK